ncbi:prolyl oligopeptidase family serine peptidase [Croceitalea dokdonensis]|nr:PHB depolymerase family esterase [Croceitalea dokdonensis]
MINKLLLLCIVISCALSCSAQSRLVEGKMVTVTEEKLEYYLYYPKEYDESKEKGFGILVFLHGGGESGEELELIKKNGPPKLLVQGKEFPFLVLAPQNPHKRQWWNIRAVNKLVDEVVTTNNVDENRIYLTGLSRGGGAAWSLAVQYPEKWAALAVVCGMAPAPYAHWIAKELPIWVFHGDEDESIPVGESDAMVQRLKELGHDVKYTRYEGVGHNAWDKAYTTVELYEWIAAQQKQKN